MAGACPHRAPRGHSPGGTCRDPRGRTDLARPAHRPARGRRLCRAPACIRPTGALGASFSTPKAHPVSARMKALAREILAEAYVGFGGAEVEALNDALARIKGNLATHFVERERDGLRRREAAMARPKEAAPLAKIAPPSACRAARAAARAAACRALQSPTACASRPRAAWSARPPRRRALFLCCGRPLRLDG